MTNSWNLMVHPAFEAQLQNYENAYLTVRLRFTDDWMKTQPDKKYLALQYSIFTSIPSNPSQAKYLQGNTLGENYRHWRRAKFLQQYRIFFRYSSNISTIIYGWVNDSETLRAYESKTDAYVVFRKMLESGRMPNSWEELMQEAKKIS